MAKGGRALRCARCKRIWQAHQLQPHRLRTFKRSRDPAFATKLADIVGLYLDPPAHAVVLSLDEKSQCQALERTQPGLPLKPGRCQTMTHDYKRMTCPRRKACEELAQLRSRHSGTPLGGPGTYENGALPVSQNAVCLGSGLAGNARAPE